MGFEEADATWIKAAGMLCQDICPCKLSVDLVENSNWNSTDQEIIKELEIDESYNAINLLTCDPKADSPSCDSPSYTDYCYFTTEELIEDRYTAEQQETFEFLK